MTPHHTLAVHPTNNPLIHTLTPASDPSSPATAYLLKVPSQALTHPGRTPYSTLPAGTTYAHIKAFPYFVCLPQDITGPTLIRRWQDRYLAAIATASTRRRAAAAAAARLTPHGLPAR